MSSGNAVAPFDRIVLDPTVMSRPVFPCQKYHQPKNDRAEFIVSFQHILGSPGYEFFFCKQSTALLFTHTATAELGYDHELEQPSLDVEPTTLATLFLL